MSYFAHFAGTQGRVSRSLQSALASRASLLCGVLALVACSSSPPEKTPTNNKPGASLGGTSSKGETVTHAVSVHGVAEKGPFVSGAAVTLSELSTDYTQTGRSFQATILDDNGSFEFKNIELENTIATLRVDGFFFNEVKGRRSDSQVTLSAITSLKDGAERNVNLLSTLEKGRVEFLLADGMTFDAAKAKARSEVFSLFGFTSADAGTSEEVSLANENEEAAKLLTASVLLLGYRSESRLTELLSALGSDFRQDGTFDSKSNTRELVLHARALNPKNIRKNLEKRYAELGRTVSLAPFEPLVQSFIDAHADEPPGSIVNFPEGSLLDTLVLSADGVVLDNPSGLASSVAVSGDDIPFRFVIWACADGHQMSFYSPPVNFSLPTRLSGTCFSGENFTKIGVDSTGYAEFLLEPIDYQVDAYEGQTNSISWSRKFSVASP